MKNFPIIGLLPNLKIYSHPTARKLPSVYALIRIWPMNHKGQYNTTSCNQWWYV